VIRHKKLKGIQKRGNTDETYGQKRFHKINVSVWNFFTKGDVLLRKRFVAETFNDIRRFVEDTFCMETFWAKLLCTLYAPRQPGHEPGIKCGRPTF
jgi:hypothetical protein